jgi:hypothetical protein
VVAQHGNQVLVTCYDPGGQPDTTSSGITNSGWYRTIYDGNSGWISENYVDRMPVALGTGSHEHLGRVLEERAEVTMRTTAWTCPQDREVTSESTGHSTDAGRERKSQWDFSV